MEKQLDAKLKIAVIGLGYVGLPLSINLAKYFPVVGFDTNLDRVKELRQGFDRTREIIPVDLQSTSMTFSITEEEIKSQINILFNQLVRIPSWGICISVAFEFNSASSLSIADCKWSTAK